MFDNLRAEQARKNFSNNDMARLIGMNPATYAAKIKNGRFSITETRLICEIFNMDFNYLFHIEDEETSQTE